MSSDAPPPLDSERWARIEALFHEASDLPEADRGEFLEGACGADLELREAVERFLAADAQSDALVDESIAGLALPLLTGLDSSASPDLPSGTRVDRYRLLEVIGSGGMGTVYRAERADGAYEREVALKMVRTGRLVGEAEQRFRRERQILARLQHPGIATLLDGGLTEDGQPFLAMELVSGQTITEYAEAHQLGMKERIRLALQVVDAVDYAHRNLVVHRDLKPSNIMVSEDGVVQLLDFGIARLLNEEAEEGVTRTGMFLLTPDYAAPEQIQGEAITTSTDVYALGVILYELLTGRRPFGPVGSTWSELERVLKEIPPSLSRIEGLDRSARRALAGDLDTIVGKALQKDPGRRYSSVQAVGDDLRRHLDGRPVAAQPDSLGYRFSKFVRRNRVATASTAAVLLALSLGAAGTAWQAREARLEAARGQAVGDFLFSLFEGVDPDQNPGEPVTALELLEAGLIQVDSLKAGPEAQVDLLTVLGILFGKLGQVERSSELLTQAVAEAQGSLSMKDPATGKALDALGVRLVLTGDVDEAERVLQEALEARQRAGAPPMDVATTQGNLARAFVKQGRPDEAIGMYRSAISTLDETTNGDSLVFTSELMGLGQVYQAADRLEEAEELFVTVLRLQEGEPESPFMAITLHNLGVLRANQSDLEGAERFHRDALAMWRRIFPGGHPEISRSLEQYARVAQEQGQWTAADSLYREAIDEWALLYGDAHPHLASIWANQANLRYRMGEFQNAAAAYREAIRVWRTIGDEQTIGVGLSNLGVIERERGAYESSDTLLAEALAIRRDLYDDPHTDIALTLNATAGLRNLQSRFGEAEALAREAMSQYDELLPPEHSAHRGPQQVLGISLVSQGRFSEARPILQALHRVYVETLNPADARIGTSSLWLGICLARLGERAEGEERVASVEGCRYVDEVVSKAPLTIDRAWIAQHSIDLILHGNDLSSEMEELFYKTPIEMGIYRSVGYTPGISTTEIIARITAAEVDQQ